MLKNYLFERLYLYKDNADRTKDIFVDKCPIIQHQLDGIRFLYRAFKNKKKHGVVLNDPSGYGKRVQTALFLSAVLPTLDKPVLILCREGNEQWWKSYFHEFTSVSDDVRIELDNPLVKKKVVISLPYTAPVTARQEWSVIVIDDDLTKPVLKTSWRAKLRVWITSSDIKEDLSKFSTFYTWVYPEEKFNSEKYKANQEDLRDVLRKAAMLDAFLEDTVLRRDNGERTFNNQVYRNNTEIRITKKNKDATGTKIKRSKRKSMDDNNSTTHMPNKVASVTKNTTENTIEPERDSNDKPFKVAKDTEDFKLGDMNTQEEFAPLRKNKTKPYRIQWESDTEDEEIEVGANKSQSNTNEDKNISQIEESGESIVLHWDDTDSQSGFNDITDRRLNVADKMNCTSNEASKTDFKVDETVENELEDEGVVEAQLEPLPNINTGNELEKTNMVNDNMKYSEDLFSTDLTKNDIENIIIESKTPIENNKVSEDLFSTDLTTNPVGVKEIVYDDTQENTNEDLKIGNILETKNTAVEHVENNKKTNRSENPNLSSFELKLKEMEELAMKKFKGSFLDSIF